MKVIEISNLDRNEYIKKFENKKLEILSYMNNFYKYWNKLLNLYIEDIEEDIENLRNPKIKFMSFDDLNITLEDIIYVYFRNYIGLYKAIYKDRFYLEEEIRFSKVYAEKTDLFNNKIRVVKNNHFFCITVDEFFKTINIFLEDDRRRANYKPEKDYIHIGIEVKEKDIRHKVMLREYFFKETDFKFWDNYKLRDFQNEIKEIEFSIYVNNGLRKLYRFKGKELTKENLFKHLSYVSEDESLDYEKILKEVFGEVE